MALSEGLDIRLNTAVTQVRYSNTGVEVVTSCSRNPGASPVTFKGI